MDDLPRALDVALLKELECPVCMEYMVPPIKLCTNGHNICSKCRETVQCCPTCRAMFSEVRSVALENIARSQKYPCANRQSGCLDLFSCEHIAEHHTVCLYGKIRCPFKSEWNCSWNGLKSDLKEHVKEAHPLSFHQNSRLRSDRFKGRSKSLMCCLGQLFLHYKRVQDDRMYCAVQLIGTSSEASKYKCEFTLLAANGVERISKTFFVRGYSEEFETIFNSGKCLCLDEAVVRHFIVENKLNMTVTLSTV
jgi:E3 ubiquitin-protein ligase SIAH1